MKTFTDMHHELVGKPNEPGKLDRAYHSVQQSEKSILEANALLKTGVNISSEMQNAIELNINTAYKDWLMAYSVFQEYKKDFAYIDKPEKGDANHHQSMKDIRTGIRFEDEKLRIMMNTLKNLEKIIPQAHSNSIDQPDQNDTDKKCCGCILS